MHVIDGIEHRSYSQPDISPLAFLEEESSEKLIFGCNRIRPTEYVELFEEEGFEVVEFRPSGLLNVSADERSSMQDRFSRMSLPDLEIGRATFFLRRL